MRRSDPAGYVRLVVSIVPKKIPVKDESSLAQLSDDELDEAIRVLGQKIPAVNV